MADRVFSCLKLGCVIGWKLGVWAQLPIFVSENTFRHYLCRVPMSATGLSFSWCETFTKSWIHIASVCYFLQG